MVQKSEGRRAEKSLESLPPSTDKEFWKDANINLSAYRESRCAHSYTKEGRTLKCEKCGSGLFLDSLDVYDDGHLYRDGQLVF